MAEQSKIEWTDATFNPWWGCEKISPGCKHCYAEAFAKRTGHKVWGKVPRRLFGPKHWAEPEKWARKAAALGVRARVFCASMADVFEDAPELEPERRKLWALIRSTFFTCKNGCDWTDIKPVVTTKNGRGTHCNMCSDASGMGGLDWLLLTKRPENIAKFLPADVAPLVWVGATVEDQEHAEKRIPHLLLGAALARVRFLSCEPLLGPLDLSEWLWGRAHSPREDPAIGVNWVIAGGESGHGARPFDVEWARTLRAQCLSAGVPFFMKQLGAYARDASSGVWRVNPALPDGKDRVLFLSDPKGGDAAEFPADLRVRQFPEVR